jgi:hypothetical protein
MHAFKFELANVYRNLTNVVLRLSPADPVAAAKKAVLVNSHYDSMMGTVGGWVGGLAGWAPWGLSKHLWLHSSGAAAVFAWRWNSNPHKPTPSSHPGTGPHDPSCHCMPA